MDVINFVNSIYLGDRACKKVIVDGWSNEVCIQVDEISRVRSPDGQWHFYNNENIVDGLIVFKQAKKIDWGKSGEIPNGYIHYLEVAKQNKGLFLFTMSIESHDQDPTGTNVNLKIIAEEICLRDPSKPEVDIID